MKLDWRRFDIAAAVFFVVAALLALIAPWMELYVEQSVEGVEQFLLVEKYAGYTSGPLLGLAGLAIIGCGLVLIGFRTVGFWVAVGGFLSGCFSYVLLNSTLPGTMSLERNESLEPAWGISTSLLWLMAGILLLLVHIWGPQLWEKLCLAMEPPPARTDAEQRGPASVSTWIAAILIVLVVAYCLYVSYPDDKGWKAFRNG